MIWIVLGCLAIFAIGIVGFCCGYGSFGGGDVLDGCISGFGASFLGVCLIVPLVLWLICATGGLMPGYGEGVRYGYVTKMSHRGLYWKTHEGQMQIGTGEMAALQSPFCFCVPDEEVREQIMPLMGTRQKVGLRYRQWFIIPFRLGSSGYEIIGVEFDAATGSGAVHQAR